MAASFEPEQLASLRAALQDVTGGEEGPAQLLRGLGDQKQTAFGQEAVDGIGAALAALDKPLEERPVWTGAKGRGLFFVFEGLDRSGKSTQSKKLTKRLEALPLDNERSVDAAAAETDVQEPAKKRKVEVEPVKWMCFPNRATPTGTLIDLYLRRQIELPDDLVHQLFSANRWEVASSIVADLNRGTSIVCDRYAFSGVAYSAAKGLDFTWCQKPDLGLPTPDGIFFLHVDESVGASRQNFGDERYENTDMQAKVRQEFRRLPLRAGVEWRDVDGARDMEVIHQEINGVVDGIRQAEQENNRPIRRLWMP